MTAITVTSVTVLDNPSLVSNPLQFEIQYECLYDLADGARPAETAAPPDRPAGSNNRLLQPLRVEEPQSVADRRCL